MQRFLFLLSVIVLLIGVSPVSAAPAAHDAAPNPLDIRYDTAFWAIVVFVGLLVVLRQKAWDPILQGLQKREETIRSSLEEAKHTRNEMERMRNDFQKELAEAHQQIPKLMEEARKKAEELSNEMRARSVADIQVERERLRHEIEIAKDQAIKELWEKSAQVATLIAANAIGRSLTDDDHRRLLDEAMLQMRQARN